MLRRGSSLPGCLMLASIIMVLLMVGIAAAVILADGAGLPLPPAASPTEMSGIDRAWLQAYLFLRGRALSQPAGDPAAMAEIIVLPGESAEAVIDSLVAAQIVDEPALLSAYLRLYGLDTRIQAGRYALSGSMSAFQIAEALQLAIISQQRLTVPEGWRLEQIAEALPSDGTGVSPEDFLRAAQRGEALQELLGVTAESTEGFLFPDTYALGESTSAEDLVQTMVETFDDRVGPSLRSGFEGRGLTLFQGVIMASVIEREAVIAEERPLIASVFINRLQQGMRLEADPTVQYALGRQPDGSWWKASLTQADLESDSPYNTYLYAGLPPSPIANPGLASLSAVAAPAQTDFLFFRAACDGSGRHLFAETFDEHLNNACP